MGRQPASVIPVRTDFLKKTALQGRKKERIGDFYRQYAPFFN